MRDSTGDTADGESDYLRMVRRARAAGQSFLHDPDLRLSERQRQAARDNLVILGKIIDEETA
jgi:hypothetical protein